MRKIPDPGNELSVRNKTVFEKEVKKIKWDIVDGQNKNKVIVICSDGSVYAAQHVIVTVSLGVLKERADSMFEPALPEEKLNAIKGLSFGTVDKILLKFPYKWWPDGFTFYSVLKTNETAHCTIEKCWVQDVFGFQDEDNQPLVLSVWLSGSAARHMEQLSEEEIKREMFQFISRIMGRALNVTVPSPALILRSSWSSNPHFRGSYSFRSMETERMGVSAAQLSEPVANSNGISHN
jgi:monoamine oxidase